MEGYSFITFDYIYAKLSAFFETNIIRVSFLGFNLELKWGICSSLLDVLDLEWDTVAPSPPKKNIVNLVVGILISG